MEAKELRVGNYIKLYYPINDKIIRVSPYHINKLFKGEKKYKPIQLTEEWLLRFGFEKRNDGDFDLFKFSEVDIVISKDFDLWKCDGICFSVNALQYVHQLQNLYFALTGEELRL